MDLRFEPPSPPHGVCIPSSPMLNIPMLLATLKNFHRRKPTYLRHPAYHISYNPAPATPRVFILVTISHPLRNKQAVLSLVNNAGVVRYDCIPQAQTDMYDIWCLRNITDKNATFFFVPSSSSSSQKPVVFFGGGLLLGGNNVQRFQYVCTCT